MKHFICTNCGVINDGNIDLICQNCGNKIDKEFYSELRNYAHRAVHYGYDYRIEYEKQYEKHGEIKIMYSLLDPSSYYELIAIAALSGMVGNLAYDLVKAVASQIWKKLTSKKKEANLDNDEELLLELVSNNTKLNEFTVYVQAYYKNLKNVKIKVKHAIIEEEMADVASKDKVEDFKDALEEDKLDLQKILMDVAREVGRKRFDKPKRKELKELFPVLKKELKAHKKSKKKSKNKKKNAR